MLPNIGRRWFRRLEINFQNNLSRFCEDWGGKGVKVWGGTSELGTNLTCNLISVDILTTYFIGVEYQNNHKVFKYYYFRIINVLNVLYLVYDKTTTFDKEQVECNAK
jgi:hypothetical protein